MKTDIHPKYVDAEIRCACGNIIKTRSTKQTIIIGICNSCHPFYTGTQKFVDTAGRDEVLEPGVFARQFLRSLRIVKNLGVAQQGFELGKALAEFFDVRR